MDQIYGTSVDKTYKTHQKVIDSKLMFKASAIHTNDYATALRNRCRDDGVVQLTPLPQRTFFQLLHIMNPRTADRVLKDAPDAVVHTGLKFGIIGWLHLWG